MLKFFKRQSSQLRHNVADLIPNSPLPAADILLLNNSHVHQTLFSSLNDEGLFDIDILPHKEQSHLPKALDEVLKNENALSFFVQFMQSHNALCYLHCWLDMENFHSAIHHFHDLLKPVVNDTPNLTKVECDSSSVSTDVDSMTADTTSLNEDSNMTISEQSNAMNASPPCNKVISPTNSKHMQEFTEDALGIFKKYIALEAPENINCSDDIRNEIVENICSSQKVLTIHCFKKAQRYVFNLMDKEYFEAFTHSDFFCKYQIDVLTSGNVVLEDIVYNETALFYFMEFLEQENSRYLLEFWLAATNFHQQLQDQKEFLDPIEAQNDAVILYDKYFSLQALCPLGFGDKVRFAVEQNICGEHGLMSDCFSLPLRIVEQVLNKHYLHPFLASQLFYKHLSELINAMQSSGYCTYDRSSGILHSSDCGSERSVCTNSTFLAKEVHKRKKIEKGNAADMNIDSRELYDPDALWRRKKHHRLSFGRVTELGQFVTDFEPEPDKKTYSKLRNVVKRFVNLEEDKKKEELAWQVAEMIVKGITNVTLCENELQS